MTAYMVVFAKVKDRERFIADYAAPTAKLLGDFGGKYLVRTPRTEALEGGFGPGFSAVISVWPDRAAIERFWSSPEYQPLKAARAALADCHVIVLEDPS
jgi:uncharacterized protein (DUF1330 family)